MLKWQGVRNAVLTVALATAVVGCGGAAGTDGDTATSVNGSSEQEQVSVTTTADTDEDSAEAEGTTPEEAERLFIIDTDTGADDVSALMIAAKTPGVKILGVTTLSGNVSMAQSTDNALMALELAGSDAPVYPGSHTTYEGVERKIHSIMGSDGMGDLDLVHPTRTAETTDAIDFIVETVAAHPGEVEILELGPATNIARALDRDEATMSKVKRIWSMGTTGTGPGNATPVAEFNVYMDPPAYQRMLDSGLPITIVGLDAGVGAGITEDQFEELMSEGDLCEFTALSFTKMRELYKHNGSDRTPNYDGLTAMCALYPDFVLETASYHGECVTDEGICRGQVVLFKEGFTYDFPVDGYDYNVDLVRAVDGASFTDAFSRILQDLPPEPFGQNED